MKKKSEFWLLTSKVTCPGFALSSCLRRDTARLSGVHVINIKWSDKR